MSSSFEIDSTLNTRQLIQNQENSKLFFFYKVLVYVLSFITTFIIFLKTMNPSSFGYDTTWFHIQIPELAVGQTTGFPLAFLLGKLFTYLPFGTMAYRLNVFSVFWGAATITVFVMIISNLLKKEYYIALVSTLFFAFFKVFWVQTNRFEVYTLHSFLIGLIILFGIYWTQSKKDKFLYLYYLFIGLSFTNHPLSVFLAPALILFPVFTDWRTVLKAKKVVIIIALIIAPLLLYLYIPIRSFQGHGNITTWHKFFDYITGSKWKQQFGFRSFTVFKKQANNYFSLIKDDFGIISALIILAGIIFMIKKNIKYFFLILALIVLNLIPVFLYEDKPNTFYLISVITFLMIPFAYGLHFIKAAIVFTFRKISDKISLKGNEKSSKNKAVKSICIIFLIFFYIAIAAFPLHLCALNFQAEDKSHDTQIYDYWKNVISEMKPDSVLITSSKSSSVAFYLTKYEFDKNIEIKIGLNDKKLKKFVNENLGKKNIYFNQVYLPPMAPFYELKQIGYETYWKDYKEPLKTFEILGCKKIVDFKSSDNTLEMKFGEEKTFSYTIKNPSSTDLVYIDSIELKLPKSLKLTGMDEALSNIKDMPGKARGIYMWTKGPYVLEAEKELVIALKIQAVAPGEDHMEFQITTMKVYEIAPEIPVKIK